jgi:hypothetical protein
MTQPGLGPRQSAPPRREREDGELEKEVTLLELLDRVLDKGVVLSGDITLSVADVDLIYVGLRVLLSSIEAAQRHQSGAAGADQAPSHTPSTPSNPV